MNGAVRVWVDKPTIRANETLASQRPVYRVMLPDGHVVEGHVVTWNGPTEARYDSRGRDPVMREHARAWIETRGRVYVDGVLVSQESVVDTIYCIAPPDVSEGPFFRQARPGDDLRGPFGGRELPGR